MINKLFHSRIFAVCTCAAFALAFLLAIDFDAKQNTEFSNADLLVAEEEARQELSESAIPVFRVVPQNPAKLYATEKPKFEPILLDELPAGPEEFSRDRFNDASSESLLIQDDEFQEYDGLLADELPLITQPLAQTNADEQYGGGDFRPRPAMQWDSQVATQPVPPADDFDTGAIGIDVPIHAASSNKSAPTFLPGESAEIVTEPPSPSTFRAKDPKSESAVPNPPAELVTKSPVSKTPKSPLQDGDSLNPTNFRLAEQPKADSSFHPHQPDTDSRTWLVKPNKGDFHPGPIYDGLPYDPYGQMNVYEGKTLNATQRPLLEVGRPWYQLGQLPEGSDFLGKHNQVSPQLIVFGDMRTAYASNNQVNDSDSQIAFEWNMNWDLRLTSTERFAWFLAPTNKGESNTRFELDNDRYVDEWNADFVFGYFEGDLGAIVGGATGQTLPFDLPFAVGVMPLLFQNGVWLEDQFLGVAATIPARHNRRLGISNMDVTFFAGYDEILSPAFNNEDDVARLYGMASFIEAGNGYWEVDYAYLEDRDSLRDRSYHNIGIGYSRRYGRWISNSTRIIINAGQSATGGPNTADGVLLLSENSLITALPSSIIPYFNFFAGFDRPQKAAGRDVLRNTGILFESDGMTGYPTLDPSAQNTFGGAIGVNIMPSDWSQQLVLETAFLGVMGDLADRNAVSEQYGVGARYQLPLNNSVILRADAMYGMLRDSDDINGVRVELRRKF